MLAADVIYFPDPKQATAGIHFAKVLERLGIAHDVAARLQPHPNGATAMRELSQSRDARPIVCTQVTEILATPGVTLVGPLPKGFELMGESIGDREYTILRNPEVREATEWFTVPKGHFFAAGDNRMRSHDSRAFGPVPLADVLGRAVLVWMSQHDGAINHARSGIVVR